MLNANKILTKRIQMRFKDKTHLTWISRNFEVRTRVEKEEQNLKGEKKQTPKKLCQIETLVHSGFFKYW